MPRHVIALTVTVVALFALMWFGVFVLRQSPNRALLASVLTIFLLGIGVSYSMSTLRGDTRDRNRE
jgi:predicted RND superfamily exporter protein